MARKSGRGGGLPWAGILVLAAIALGVFVARTLAASQAPARSVVPATIAPTKAATIAPAAAALPTAVPTARPAAVKPTATPQVVKATATPEPAKPSATPQPARPTSTPEPARPTATPQSVKATAAPQSVKPTATAAAPTPTALAQRVAAGAVALTFDAGADRGYASDILDLLAEDSIPGSFGITGNWAKANPDLMRRIAAEGHMVINHTLDHRSFTGVSDNLGGLSPGRRRQELDDADAIIAPLIGHSTRPWYRLPYGDGDAHVAADVAPAGYDRQVGWTVDSFGWRGATDQDIVARCLKLAAPKAIFLFHVGHASRDGPALQTVINGLKERGYSFVRVDEL